jgi:hypothetical protein
MADQNLHLVCLIRPTSLSFRYASTAIAEPISSRWKVVLPPAVTKQLIVRTRMHRPLYAARDAPPRALTQPKLATAYLAGLVSVRRVTACTYRIDMIITGSYFDYVIKSG